MRGGILGLGLLMGGAVFSYGRSCRCHKAEILAIRDDGALAACLAQYLTRSVASRGEALRQDGVHTTNRTDAMSTFCAMLRCIAGDAYSRGLACADMPRPAVRQTRGTSGSCSTTATLGSGACARSATTACATCPTAWSGAASACAWCAAAPGACLGAGQHALLGFRVLALAIGLRDLPGRLVGGGVGMRMARCRRWRLSRCRTAQAPRV